MAQTICQFKDYIFFPPHENWPLTCEENCAVCRVLNSCSSLFRSSSVRSTFQDLRAAGNKAAVWDPSPASTADTCTVAAGRRKLTLPIFIFFLVVSWKLSVFLCQQFGDFLTEGEDKEIFILRFVHVYLYFSIILICISNPILIFSKILQLHSICKTFCSCYLSLIQHFIGHNREPNEFFLY